VTAPCGATQIFSSERIIVIGVDGYEQSGYALDWAAREAKARDAVLYIVSVAPTGNGDVPQWIADDAALESSAIVAAAVESVASAEPTVVVRGDVLRGSAAHLLAEASEVAELLVVGDRGKGVLGTTVLGSVSQSCTRLARCPVVVVASPQKAPGSESRARIVVERSDRALRWAHQEAALRPADVEVMAAGATSSKSDQMRGSALIGAPHGADLLVVEASHHTAIRHRLTGSLAHHLVHRSPCPVVVIGPSTREVTDPAR
jgi:nucleotide-binding universal stress UspA family protein